jgi:hypothetical protein
MFFKDRPAIKKTNSHPATGAGWLHAAVRSEKNNLDELNLPGLWGRLSATIMDATTRRSSLQDAAPAHP